MSTTVPEQSAANHARMVPAYHYFGGLLTLVILVWSAYGVTQDVSRVTVLQLGMAIILTLLFWYARAFALAVQDRVIRLEERLRLARLLPTEMHPHIDTFTKSQLIAMRFASDAELADLARRVLAENIHDAKAIKASIKSWRADHARA
ncbi:MAG: DUF6526 family protein [Longimicrobiales bacterium]